MSYSNARSFRRSQRFLLVALALICACGRPTKPLPAAAFREIAPPALSDDLNFAGLAEGLRAQRTALKNTSSTMMHFGPETISRADYLVALDKLEQVLASSSSERDTIDYIKQHFRFFEIYGGKDWGEILLTSYFEPIISGSTSPNARHSQPLYALPRDLVTIELKSFSERFKDERALKGRVDQHRIVPFYSREEIDGRGALRGRGLELCWVDPIEAFFLQIQGSGTVKLESGEALFITYADKNGHRYEAIGKFLKHQIAPHKVTMQRVESTLRRMSAQERDQILFQNPSYVFFKSSKQRAITALGVPATPGRTIAADPTYAPKGALALLSFSKPILKGDDPQELDPVGHTEVSRFVLDQDSGGAITGTDRVDLFWGRGDEAKRYAGVIQDSARIIYLFPSK